MSFKLEGNYKKIIYLITPLICIYAGETAKLAFLFELKKHSNTAGILNSLIISLSLVGGPFIGLFSDKNCRKKTIVFLVAFELLVLILLGKFNFIASFIQGLIGSAIVAVSRAAYLDIRPHILKTEIHSKSEYRNAVISGSAVVETIIIQATAWTLHSIKKDLNLTLFSIYLFIIASLLLIFFTDIRDKDKKIPDHEISSAKKEYLSGYSWLLLVSFFLYDFAFQIPNYYSESYSILSKLNTEINISGLGILCGCLLVWAYINLTFYIKSLNHFASFDKKILNQRLKKTIFYVSIGYFTLFLIPFIQYKSFFNSIVNPGILLAFDTLGGVLLSLYFIYFTLRVTAHERGFLYGIMEETETLAESITPIFVLYLPFKHLSNLPFLILIGLGLICIRDFRGKKLNNEGYPK